MWTVTINTTIVDPVTGEQIPYLFSAQAEEYNTAEYLARAYASMVEYGMLAEKWVPTDPFFPREALFQWISPQQLLQFEKMYPDCVAVSYSSALGYIYSQIGHLYDLDAIFEGDTDEGTARIMRWIMTVLTAYNISSPSANHSQSLQDNFDMVCKKVTEMKTGATTVYRAPLQEDPNAWGGVVNGNKYKQLG